MTGSEVLFAIIIHLLVPFVGILVFIRLIRKMNREQISYPPVLSLFLIFFNYGILLILVLTVLFWQWSGLASLGAFYLLVGAPAVMGLIAYHQQTFRQTSRYHRAAYKASLAYYAIFPLTFLLLAFLDVG